MQLKSAPAADGTSLGVVKAEKDAFRSAASKAGVRLQERYSYDTLFNGLSIHASRGDVQKIKALPGVTAVWPVAIVDAPPKGGEPAPDLFTAIDMTGATIAQNELGYDGKGIKVAVMDTGIDVDHPAFGGDGSARSDSPLSDRVAYGYDFVGDAFNADPTSTSYNPTPMPDANPDDCNGHGTHVAGIVGANDATNGMKGVAPAVTFGAYRVFGCDGVHHGGHHDRRDGARARRRHGRAQHEHRLVVPVAAVSDRHGGQPARQQGRGRRRLDRQQRRKRPLRGRRARPRRESHRHRVVRQHPRSRCRTFTVSPANRTIGYTNATGGAAAADVRQLAAGADGNSDDSRRRLHGPAGREPRPARWR